MIKDIKEMLKDKRFLGTLAGMFFIAVIWYVAVWVYTPQDKIYQWETMSDKEVSEFVKGISK